MPTGTGMKHLEKAMPDRYIDVGIAEEHGVIFAAGMATMGFHPVVAIYSTFLQRAYDCIHHDVCLQDLPVIFCMDRAGLSANDGPTHHGLFDISYLRCLPNVIAMAPANEDELADMMFTATHQNHPTFIRYPRGRRKACRSRTSRNCLKSARRTSSRIFRPRQKESRVVRSWADEHHRAKSGAATGG
ncbi:MAG: hypothetical protein WDM80_06445 [Limisphaerales bacterium]